ncbi:lamin tail domain-containing protein [Candidatus Pacearchaeota archaeon]|nr:lamin tail domain-containing protein [Candidatus Pacearchaeota archaeon]
MRFLALMIFVVLLINLVSAIRINEVEINPMGGSGGNEWIELYNDGTNLDISSWEIYEGIVGGIVNPKKILIIPNDTVIEENSYYTIELSSSKLNNDGDFVILYDSSDNEVDRTEIFGDSSSGTKTWQYCSSLWEFIESTKNTKNSCSVTDEENEETNSNNNTNNSEIEVNVEVNIGVENETGNSTTARTSSVSNKNAITPMTSEVIKLNADSQEDIKSENSFGNLYSNWAIISLGVFSVVIALLLLLKNKTKKNGLV